MVKCPNCKKEMTKPVKKWRYGHFITKAYLCEKCGTHFNEYTKDGNHSFTLRLDIGKGYRKV
jgi:transposase-like protein